MDLLPQYHQMLQRLHAALTLLRPYPDVRLHVEVLGEIFSLAAHAATLMREAYRLHDRLQQYGQQATQDTRLALLDTQVAFQEAMQRLEGQIQCVRVLAEHALY